MAHTIMTKVGECFGKANAEVGASKKIRKTRACSRHKRHYTCYIVISWWTSSHDLDVLSSSIAKALSKQLLMLNVFFGMQSSLELLFANPTFEWWWWELGWWLELLGGGRNKRKFVMVMTVVVLSRTLLTMIMTLQVFSSSASAMDSPYYNPLTSMNITYNAMMRPVPAHW